MKSFEPNLDPKTVAERAYELFLARGGEHGHDLEDWVRAEQELRTNGTTRPNAPRPVTRPRGKR